MSLALLDKKIATTRFGCLLERREEMKMSGVSIDHLVSIVVLVAAVLLFIGLFNQTLSVAVDYQTQYFNRRGM